MLFYFREAIGREDGESVYPGRIATGSGRLFVGVVVALVVGWDSVISKVF